MMKKRLERKGHMRPDTEDNTKVSQNSIMNPPILLTVGYAADDLSKVERELTKRYAADYRIMTKNSSELGMRVLEEYAEDVAVVLADQKISGTTGIEFLARANHTVPHAKRALLISWDDREAAELMLKSMALGQIDHYIFKPLQLPDEQFHRAIVELLDEWTSEHRPGRYSPHWQRKYATFPRITTNPPRQYGAMGVLHRGFTQRAPAPFSSRPCTSRSRLANSHTA
jgi:DNA-binding NarL/FixJ family response regulator